MTKNSGGSESAKDGSPPPSSFLLPYYQTLYSVSQQGAQQDGRKVHATTYTPEVGTLPSVTAAAHSPPLCARTTSKMEVTSGADVLIKSNIESRRVSCGGADKHGSSTGVSASKHDGNKSNRSDKQSKKSASIVTSPSNNNSCKQTSDLASSSQRDGQRSSESWTKSDSRNIKSVEIKEEAPVAGPGGERGNKSSSFKTKQKTAGLNNTDKKHQDEDRNKMTKANTSKSSHRDVSTKHCEPSRSDIKSPKEEPHSAPPCESFVNQDQSVGHQYMYDWNSASMRHGVPVDVSRSVAGGYMLPYPPPHHPHHPSHSLQGMSLSSDPHHSRLVEMGFLQHPSRLSGIRDLPLHPPSVHASDQSSDTSHSIPREDADNKRNSRVTKVTSPAPTSSKESSCKGSDSLREVSRRNTSHDASHATTDAAATSGKMWHNYI